MSGEPLLSGAPRRSAIDLVRFKHISDTMPRKPKIGPGLACARSCPSAAKQGLLAWANGVMAEQGQTLAAHHRLLLWELDAISRGSIDRLMVLMPPGSAKSTYTTVLFPVWWFGQYPSSSVISTCHTASLATRFARQVRQLVTNRAEQLGYRLDAKARATAEWRTSAGGEYFSSGVRGPIMGRRADLAIIDDPIKGQTDADSSRIRDQLWDWYHFDLTTRLKPHARVILVMTRWHQDDLAGRLLARNPKEWRCLSLPALAEPADPLGRAPEAPLWPDWEDKEGLFRRRKTLGHRAWSALYQQAPSNAGSALFQVERIELVDQLPQDMTRCVRAWDLAATPESHGGDPDWTVGVKLIRQGTDHFIVADVVRARVSPYGLQELLVETARRDGLAVPISLPTDPGQSGKSQIRYLTAALAGYVIKSSAETGSKEARARPVAAQVEGRNVSILRSSWNHIFLDELREFPFGRKDDQVDALARAFGFLTEAAPAARRTDVSIMAR